MTSQNCPPIASSPSLASVDYVDFLQANRTQYIADLQATIAVSPGQVGPEQLRVRCSFSQLNDSTQRMTPKAEDGDAAYLAPGTPVFAVNGWSPLCRLVARRDGQWHLYLAYLDNAAQATPKPCALDPRAISVTPGLTDAASTSPGSVAPGQPAEALPSPSLCAGHAFSLSLASSTGGQPSPLAAAAWFGLHGRIAGVPVGGWQILSRDTGEAQAQSGGVVLHLIRGPDRTWQVDSGTTCS